MKKLNLSIALEAIDAFYFSQADNAQKEFLNGIKNQIATIQAQDGWLKMGLIARYEADHAELEQIGKITDADRRYHELEQYIFERILLAKLDNITKELEKIDTDKTFQNQANKSDLLNIKNELTNKLKNTKLMYNALIKPGEKTIKEQELIDQLHQKYQSKIQQQSRFIHRLLLKPFTQDELVKEAAEAQYKSNQFTISIIKKMKKRLKRGIAKAKTRRDTHYYQHLLFLFKCVNAIYINLKETIDDKYDKSKKHFGFYLSKNEYFTYTSNSLDRISDLGGRYIPLNQINDVLQGRIEDDQGKMDVNPGLCYGYSIKSAKELEGFGYMRSLLRATNDVYYWDMHQYEEDIQVSWKKSFRPNQDMRTLIDEVIHQLDTDHIYLLGIGFWHYADGHAMLIRRLDKTNEIEFVDPNLALVVMNVDAFKIWLSLHLIEEYAKKTVSLDEAKLDLSPVEKLKPADKKPTIPPLVSMNSHYQANLDQLIANSKFIMSEYFVDHGLSIDKKLKESKDADQLNQFSVRDALIGYFVFGLSALGFSTINTIDSTKNSLDPNEVITYLAFMLASGVCGCWIGGHATSYAKNIYSMFSTNNKSDMEQKSVTKTSNKLKDNYLYGFWNKENNQSPQMFPCHSRYTVAL